MDVFSKNIIVIGAGGHAKVILATLSILNYNIEGVLDDNPKLLGEFVLGYKVIGDISYLKRCKDKQVICALGDNKLRHKIATAFANLNWISLVHPRAYVHESVALGKGSVVFAGAVVQPDTRVGEHVIINTASSVDHDCEIENFAHIAPGSHLGGGVKVGEGALVGIGSSVKPYSTIGQWSLIGAGSAVVHDIESYTHAKGTPAKA